jgi:hypothetical protein
MGLGGLGHFLGGDRLDILDAKRVSNESLLLGFLL